jgi:hypothetical protein
MSERLDQPQGLMSIYTERAHLVALLARIYPSHAYFPDDADPNFACAVCIHFPWGQATYHIQDDDFRVLFRPWVLFVKSDYDGHTTDQKYSAMRQAILDNDVQAYNVS